MRPLLTAVVLTLAASLAGQNIIRWDAWKPGPLNPSYIKKLKLTPSGLSFDPGAARAVQRASISQSITVPKTGLYQLEAQGRAGLDGYVMIIRVGKKLVIDDDTWGEISVSGPVYLTAGNHILEFETDAPSNWCCGWTGVTMRLRPAITPTVFVIGKDGNTQWNATLWVSTNANILAMSLHRITPVIRIPGIGHGLGLAPSTLIILGTSSTGKISKQFYASWRMNIRIWPTAFIQAATWTQFGSVTRIVGS